VFVAIWHRHGNHTLVAVIDKLKLIELLQQATSLAAAKVAFAALRLNRLTAAGKSEALNCALVRLHLRHELFLFNISGRIRHNRRLRLARSNCFNIWSASRISGRIRRARRLRLARITRKRSLLSGQ
jgi:hypothetical protein